jgi:hypothetical protein
MTWKVWAENDDLLFEGSEAEAREYVAEHPDSSQVVLESPHGDSYRYQDSGWVLQGTAGFWGPNGVSQYH